MLLDSITKRKQLYNEPAYANQKNQAEKGEGAMATPPPEVLPDLFVYFFYFYQQDVSVSERWAPAPPPNDRNQRHY